MIGISLKPQAESDLVQIWQFTAELFGETQANDYLDYLANGIEQLSEYPLLGTNCDHIIPGYRRLVLGKHSVFYTSDANHITVVRVLHQDMDVRSHFHEER